MRIAGVALIAAAAMFTLGAQQAQAFTTCRHSHTCHHSHDQVNDQDSDDNDWNGIKDQKPVGVPEPASLALLASGVSAVGLAMYRRRRNNKKD